MISNHLTESSVLVVLDCSEEFIRSIDEDFVATEDFPVITMEVQDNDGKLCAIFRDTKKDLKGFGLRFNLPSRCVDIEINQLIKKGCALVVLVPCDCSFDADLLPVEANLTTPQRLRD